MLTPLVRKQWPVGSHVHGCLPTATDYWGWGGDRDRLWGPRSMYSYIEYSDVGDIHYVYQKQCD